MCFSLWYFNVCVEICELKVLIYRPEILLASESVVYSIIFTFLFMKCLIYEIGLSVVEAMILPSSGKGTVSFFLVCIKPTKKRKADRTSRVSIKQQLES